MLTGRPRNAVTTVHKCSLGFKVTAAASAARGASAFEAHVIRRITVIFFVVVFSLNTLIRLHIEPTACCDADVSCTVYFARADAAHSQHEPKGEVIKEGNRRSNSNSSRALW